MPCSITLPLLTEPDTPFPATPHRLDLVSAHVAVSRHRIETRAVSFDRFTQVGFVGSVTYQVIKRRLLNDDLMRRFNILADYAPFCGTGHKTTQGMGHTQRL